MSRGQVYINPLHDAVRKTARFRAPPRATAARSRLSLCGTAADCSTFRSAASRRATNSALVRRHEGRRDGNFAAAGYFGRVRPRPAAQPKRAFAAPKCRNQNAQRWADRRAACMPTRSGCRRVSSRPSQHRRFSTRRRSHGATRSSAHFAAARRLLVAARAAGARHAAHGARRSPLLSRRRLSSKLAVARDASRRRRFVGHFGDRSRRLCRADRRRNVLPERAWHCAPRFGHQKLHVGGRRLETRAIWRPASG